MNYGLDDKTLKLIKNVFSKYAELSRIVLYGSRAKGTYRDSSDIDLCIMDKISLNLLYKIEDDLDELFLPYKIDISIYEKLDNRELRNHINRIGKEFYQT